MTEIISFRPKRSKREIKEAFGNVTAKLNELIERELAAKAKPPTHWTDILKRTPAPCDPEKYEEVMQCIE